MAFTINHGSPGILMAFMILIGVAVVAIIAYVMISVVRSARNDVLDDDEPES
jgi:hypothetical protein